MKMTTPFGINIMPSLGKGEFGNVGFEISSSDFQTLLNVIN